MDNTNSLPQPGHDGSYRHVPEQAGMLEHKAQLPDQFPVSAEPDWITVVEAQEQFRALGLPRSAEAIRKYCRQGKLEAEVIAGPKGDQHMIKRDSIDVFVTEQLKVLEAASRTIPVRDGTTRHIPVHSVTYRNDPEQTGTARDQGAEDKIKELTQEIERLKRENRDLEIDKEVRTRMNDMLEKNNDRLIGQVREVSQEAQEWSRKFGQLEERVQHLQIAAPVASSRPAPAEPEVQTEPQVVTPELHAGPMTAPDAERSAPITYDPTRRVQAHPARKAFKDLKPELGLKSIDTAVWVSQKDLAYDIHACGSLAGLHP